MAPIGAAARGEIGQNRLIIARYTETNPKVLPIMSKKIVFTWAALLLLGVAAANAESNKNPKTKNAEKVPACQVAEFRGLALSTNDIQTRGEMAGDWLKTNGASCSLEKLMVIKNNRALWLGTADSIQLMSLVDGALELKMDANPELLAQLSNAKKNTAASPAEAQPTVPGNAKPAGAGEKSAKQNTL